MIVPILITAGIVGATWAFGRLPAAPAAPSKPAEPSEPSGPSDLGSGPAVPGVAAQVDDVVEVAPTSLLGTLNLQLPAESVVTKITVRVTRATPTELQGNVVSYNLFGGPPTSPTIATVSVENLPTPAFPRSIVQRVLRNGQVVAP